MERINYASGSPWEPLRGFSRAVQVGDTLYISGTTAQVASGDVVGGSSSYSQTRFALDQIKRILAGAGFKLTDVVRTRLMVTNLADFAEYARAHHEVFETVRPASSIVQVVRLVDPRLLVEIEVQAVRGVTDCAAQRLTLLEGSGGS